MSELQRQTADPYEDYKMPVEGFKGTPEEIERQWYEQCYRGRGDSIPQLTWRAVLMGSALGGVLSLTNLYIGLKAGWAFGVAITACILSFAIWNTLLKIRIARRPMTILENNCMQSTASAAGYSTGGTLVSAFSALILINNTTMALPVMMAWVFLLAVLGVTMAVPMKRQMINTEQLRFPSGVAAAETLRALHATGAKGARAAKSLLISALLAGIGVFWKEGMHVIGSRWEGWQADNLMHDANRAVLGHLPTGSMASALAPPSHLAGTMDVTWAERSAHWVDRTVMLPFDLIFVAGGMIMGLRAALSVLLGAVLCWVVFLPIVQARVPEAAEAEGYRQIVQWTLWGGVSCMVTSSLLSVALQWRSAVRAFAGLGEMFGRKGARAADDPLLPVETPMSWFAIGQVAALIGLAWLGHYSFAIPYWQSALAVVMSFAIALVACRVTGETDTTPVGPMGKIMQLTFGAVAPGNMNANIMSANIGAGAATSSADLLTDLKSGYLLGANPRKQFIAQFSGIFIGTIVTCVVFSVLITSADSLGTDQFPAPAAQTWKGVAVAMTGGLSHLHPVKLWSMAIGGLVGVLLVVLARALGEKGRYVPSAAGIGLAWTFHFYYGLAFAIGAVIAWYWYRRDKENSDEFLFPVASGIIAGGALMGVGLIFYENGADMVSTLAGYQPLKFGVADIGEKFQVAGIGGLVERAIPWITFHQ